MLYHISAVFVCLVAAANVVLGQSTITFSSASLSWSGISGKIEHHYLDGITDSTFDTTLTASCLSSISDVDASSFRCPEPFGNQYITANQLPVSSIIIGDTSITATETVINSPQTYLETFKLAIKINALHTICSQIDYDYQWSRTHGPSGSVGEHYTLFGQFPFQVDSTTGWVFRVHLYDSTFGQALASVKASLGLSSNQNRPHEITENGFDSLLVAPNATLNVEIQGAFSAVHTAVPSQTSISALHSSEDKIEFEAPVAAKGSIQVYNTLGVLIARQSIIPGLNSLPLPHDFNQLVILRFEIDAGSGRTSFISKQLLVE